MFPIEKLDLSGDREAGARLMQDRVRGLSHGTRDGKCAADRRSPKSSKADLDTGRGSDGQII